MRAAIVVLVLLVAGAAGAQDAGVDAAIDPATAAFQHAIHSDPWTGTGSEESTDPLAGGDAHALAEVTDDPDVDEVAAPVPVRHGAILEAISGVTETSHAIAVTLEGGIAVVTETMVLDSSARHRAEAMLRLAVPEHAAIVSLHVENASGARDGVDADPSAPQSAYDDALLVRSTTPSARPVAHARIADDRLIVRGAPVGTGNEGEADGTLTLRVVWAVRVPMQGGVVRLTIPARGSDDRAARAEVSVTAVDLVEPRVDDRSVERGALEVRNDAPWSLTALAPLSRGPHADAFLVPCATQLRCVSLHVTTGRARLSAAPITIAVDASPSTSVGARGRIADTVRVVSAMLPASTPVRWIAFAARTEELGRGHPADVDLARVRTAVDAPLGSATRFSALWAAIRDDARAGDRVLVIGDGGMTAGASEDASFTEARARGVIVSAIDVADRHASAALGSLIWPTGGVLVEAGAAADRAAGGHGDDLLTELVSRTIAEVAPPISIHVDDHAAAALHPTRTGESEWISAAASRAYVMIGADRTVARAPDAAHAPILTALVSQRRAMIAVEASDLDASAGACAPDGSPRARATSRASSIVGHGLRIAPAHRRSCASPASPASESTRTATLPARALRDQLRRRVVPPARACFRDDRAGRAHVHREVTFELVLADREIVDSHVEGEIPDTLRSCLLGAFDGVEVPSFDGTLVVRWPVHTEAIPPPPVIELAPDVAREVHEIAGDEPIPTAPTP